MFIESNIRNKKVFKIASQIVHLLQKAVCKSSGMRVGRELLALG